MFPICFQLMTSRTLICTRKSLISRVTTKAFSLQCKSPKRKWQYLKVQASNFHTSQRLNYEPSWISCLGSIICGYYIRKWWLKMAPTEREVYKAWYRLRRKYVHGALGLACISFIIYCLSCVQRDTVLNIPRLILCDPAKQIEDVNIYFMILINNIENVVPLSNPMYSRVAAIMRKLVRCNRDIFQDTDWMVTIIHRIYGIASEPNVFILPDRRIVIVSDIFDLIKSSDQLTYILAHEMSHEMLLHTSESLSVALLSGTVNIVFSLIIWASYPSGVAAVLCSCMYIFSAIVLSYYKRYAEAEADAVGLQLAAKSCIDLREVLVFWEIMKTFEEISGQKQLHIPIFMKHPSVEERVRKTIEMMPKALELRRKAKCPPVPTKDPRDRLPIYKKDIEKYLHKHPQFLGMRL